MMKRIFSLALCLILCLAAVIYPASAEQEQEQAPVTRIQKALEEGGDAALWELVNTHYATNRYEEEGCAELCIWSPDSPAFPVQNSTDSQLLNFYTVCIQETAGVGFTVEQMYLYTYNPDDGWTGAPYLLPDGSWHLDPYQGFSYNVFDEASGNSRYSVAVAAGTDENGHKLELYGVVQLMNGLLPESVPESPDYDTDNLRHEARFMLQVYDGVWWVPANELGKTRYTNQEIADMAGHSPEQKQEEISTLYEALQLFQISGFTGSEDNVKIPEGDIYWEHHKPGYDAVRTNTGCCASCADWLNYILSGDYEMGFIGWSLPDTNGHIFNYIYQDGWYYFVDLTHYEGGVMTPETGEMASYRFLEHPAGCFHKAKSPEDFIKYYLKTAGSEPPAKFELYQAENVIPLGTAETDDGQLMLYYPEGYDMTFIDGINPEALNSQTAPGPEKSYNWSGMKSAEIKAKKKYLSTAAEAGTEPLTAYQPGDRLALEDNSAKGTAVIDGIKYTTSRRDEVRLNFENNLVLRGEHSNGVFSYRLPLGLHSEAIENMNSLVLGDLILDVAKKVKEIQVILCIREGDSLTVQEVMDGKHYDLRRVSIHKDENGSWADSSDYWYLIVTKDKKLKYEFGRFFCSVSDEI